MIFAIDPGNVESAYCLISPDDMRPIMFAKVKNPAIMDCISANKKHIHAAAIEMIASYGMPVGREVFETCVWIGRFARELELAKIPVHFIYRKDEKMELCYNPTASDANIRRALIDRFASHDLKSGKGTKKNPDWFYGFFSDVWAAYAVGVTYLEQQKRGETNG